MAKSVIHASVDEDGERASRPTVASDARGQAISKPNTATMPRGAGTRKEHEGEKTMAKPSTTASLKQRLRLGLGLPPAKRRRWDLPRRESTSEVANTTTDDAEAITAVLDDTYTASSRRSVSARIDWWERAAKKRGMAPFPLEHSKLTLAGALLKQGKYKSASQYLYSIKKEHLRRGHAWPEQLSVQLTILDGAALEASAGHAKQTHFVWKHTRLTNRFVFTLCRTQPK